MFLFLINNIFLEFNANEQTLSFDKTVKMMVKVHCQFTFTGTKINFNEVTASHSDKRLRCYMVVIKY